MRRGKHIIGVDIGGTKIYGALYDASFNVLNEITVPTEARKGKDRVLANISQCIESLRDRKTKRIGIAFAGFVDSERGIVRKAPNIPGFTNMKLINVLEKRFGISSYIENDARLFTLAEQRMGHAKDLSPVLGIIIGTGIGGGLVVNGDIYSGGSGFSLEIGHQHASLDKKVEIESLLAGPALNRNFKKRMKGVSLDEALERCKRGEKKIQRSFDPYLSDLSSFLYNMVLCFDPKRVVLGGGVGIQVLPVFRKDIEKRVNALLSQGGYPMKLDLRMSTLKNAGSLGAALYVSDR